MRSFAVLSLVLAVAVSPLPLHGQDPDADPLADLRLAFLRNDGERLAALLYAPLEGVSEPELALIEAAASSERAEAMRLWCELFPGHPLIDTALVAGLASLDAIACEPA